MAFFSRAKSALIAAATLLFTTAAFSADSPETTEILSVKPQGDESIYTLNCPPADKKLKVEITEIELQKKDLNGVVITPAKSNGVINTFIVSNGKESFSLKNADADSIRVIRVVDMETNQKVYSALLK